MVNFKLRKPDSGRGKQADSEISSTESETYKHNEVSRIWNISYSSIASTVHDSLPVTSSRWFHSLTKLSWDF
jgi:hypothetical protein